METLGVAAIRRGGLDVDVFVRALHSYLHGLLVLYDRGPLYYLLYYDALLIRLYTRRPSNSARS
jgi:hypothetical protein